MSEERIQSIVTTKRKAVEFLHDTERPDIPDGVFESSAANYQLLLADGSFGCTPKEVRRALLFFPYCDAPRTFAAIRYCLGSRKDGIPDTVVLLFPSAGQIIQTGNVSDEIMNGAIDFHCNFLGACLQKSFIVTRKRMLNMVMNTRLHTDIDLIAVAHRVALINASSPAVFQSLAVKPEERDVIAAKYPLIAKSERFPALRIKRLVEYWDETKSLERQTFIINKNGSITCTGFRSQESLLLGRRWIYDLCTGANQLFNSLVASDEKRQAVTLQQLSESRVQDQNPVVVSQHYALRLEEYFDSILTIP